MPISKGLVTDLFDHNQKSTEMRDGCGLPCRRLGSGRKDGPHGVDLIFVDLRGGVMGDKFVDLSFVIKFHHAHAVGSVWIEDRAEDVDFTLLHQIAPIADMLLHDRSFLRRLVLGEGRAAGYEFEKEMHQRAFRE